MFANVFSLSEMLFCPTAFPLNIHHTKNNCSGRSSYSLVAQKYGSGTKRHADYPLIPHGQAEKQYLKKKKTLKRNLIRNFWVRHVINTVLKSYSPNELENVVWKTESTQFFGREESPF